MRRTPARPFFLRRSAPETGRQNRPSYRIFGKRPPAMLVRDVVVRNRAGIHTRPASMIVRAASKFASEFFIQKDGYEINGKSIIGVMTLAAEQGSTVTLVFDGADENDAAEAVVALFEDGFGEVD